MKLANLLRILGASAFSLILSGAVGMSHSRAEEEKVVGFDSYGGNRMIKGRATGFFHVQEIDGRHFLITPEGHGYRALGINHFHMMTSKDYDIIRALKKAKDAKKKSN